MSKPQPKAKKAGAPGGVSVTLKNATIGDTTVVCPGTRRAPRSITLMTSGQNVMATCGETHKLPDSARRGRCFFPLDIPADVVSALAGAKPGGIRVTMPDGKRLEAKVLPSQAGAAGGASTAIGRAAAAQGGGGKAAPPRPQGGNSNKGSALTAAFNAIGAVAGAVGQTAAAVGQVASAGASVADSAGRVAVAGIGAADSYGERRHTRVMARRTTDRDDDD